MRVELLPQLVFHSIAVPEHSVCSSSLKCSRAVLDAHKDWCGPCENMLPTYNLLLRDIEQCENRINFATADRGLFLEQLKVVAGEGSVFDIATHGCEPIFLFVKGGKVVHSVLGANAGDVLRAAKEHVPPISTDDD